MDVQQSRKVKKPMNYTSKLNKNRRQKKNGNNIVKNTFIVSDNSLISNTLHPKNHNCSWPIEGINTITVRKSQSKLKDDYRRLNAIPTGNWEILCPNSEQLNLDQKLDAKSLSKTPSNNFVSKYSKYRKICVNTFKETPIQSKLVNDEPFRMKHSKSFVVSDSTKKDNAHVCSMTMAQNSNQSTEGTILPIESNVDLTAAENEYSFSTSIGLSSCQSAVKNARKKVEQPISKLKLLDTSSDPNLFNEPYHNVEIEVGNTSSCFESETNKTLIKSIEKNNQIPFKRKASVDDVANIEERKRSPMAKKKIKLSTGSSPNENKLFSRNKKSSDINKLGESFKINEVQPTDKTNSLNNYDADKIVNSEENEHNNENEGKNESKLVDTLQDNHLQTNKHSKNNSSASKIKHANDNENGNLSLINKVLQKELTDNFENKNGKLANLYAWSKKNSLNVLSVNSSFNEKSQESKESNDTKNDVPVLSQDLFENSSDNISHNSDCSVNDNAKNVADNPGITRENILDDYVKSNKSTDILLDSHEPCAHFEGKIFKNKEFYKSITVISDSDETYTRFVGKNCKNKHFYKSVTIISDSDETYVDSSNLEDYRNINNKCYQNQSNQNKDFEAEGNDSKIVFDGDKMNTEPKHESSDFKTHNEIDQTISNHRKTKDCQINIKKKVSNIDNSENSIITLDNIFETGPNDVSLECSQNTKRKEHPNKLQTNSFIESDESFVIKLSNTLDVPSIICSKICKQTKKPSDSNQLQETVDSLDNGSPLLINSAEIKKSTHSSNTINNPSSKDDKVSNNKNVSYEAIADEILSNANLVTTPLNAEFEINTSVVENGESSKTFMNVKNNQQNCVIDGEEKLLKPFQITNTVMSADSEDILSNNINNSLGHLTDLGSNEKLMDDLTANESSFNHITVSESQLFNINKNKGKNKINRATSTPNTSHPKKKSEKHSISNFSPVRRSRKLRDKSQTTLTSTPEEPNLRKKIKPKNNAKQNLSLDKTFKKKDTPVYLSRSCMSSSLVDEIMDDIQCHMIADQSDLERLKNIKIDITWELSKLHEIDGGSQKMSHEKLRKILGHDASQLDTKKFTKEEEKKIIDNWNEFSKRYNFENPDLFMGSYQLYGYFSLEQRRNFKLFLAKGLPNRRLFSVYQKFRDIFAVTSRGRWNEKEDRLLLELYNSYDEVKGPKKYGMTRHVLLQKALGRTWTAIHRRLQIHFPDKSLSNIVKEDYPEWTPKLKGSLIYYLLKKSKLKTLDELKDLKIPPKVWEKVSEKLKVSIIQVKFHWKHILYPQLFAEKPVARNQLFIDLITWFYNSPIKRFLQIDWFEVSKHLGNLGSHFLARCFRTMIVTYVPKKLHTDFRGCVNHLNMNLLPKMLKKKKTSMIQRLIYNPRGRIVEEIDDNYIVDENIVGCNTNDHYSSSETENLADILNMSDNDSDNDSIYSKLREHPTIDSESNTETET